MHLDILFAPGLQHHFPRRRPRVTLISPRRAPCMCARATPVDQVAVQISNSKRLRRLGNADEARKALELVRSKERGCIEYAIEDSNVHALELLRDSNDGNKLMTGAKLILDKLERNRTLSPAAIAASLRVARAAATLHTPQRDTARTFADRAFDLLMRTGLSQVDTLGVAMRALVGICAALGDYDGATQFVANARRVGYEPCEKVRSLQLLAASADGRVAKAEELTEELEQMGVTPPASTFATLAGEFAAAGKHARAVDTLNNALEAYGPPGVARNTTLILAVLSSCERTGDARAARRIYNALSSSNVTPSASVIRSLLRAAFAGGDAGLAEKLLLDEVNGIAEKYTIGPDDLNRMVSAASRSPTLSRKARAKEAIRLFERANQVRPAGIGEYNVLIATLARVGDLSHARYVVDHEMPDKEVRPNIVTYNTLLHACVIAARPYVAMQIWSTMQITANQVTYNTLVNLAAESGARDLLDSVLAAMRIAPDVELGDTAVAAILKFYRRERDADGARAVVTMLQAEQRRRRVMPYVSLQAVVYVTLLIIYLENNRHHDAITLFGLLVIRRIGGARPFNAMLQHHGARRRDSSRALEILAMMKRRGVAPDATSYTIAIRAAAGARKLSLALRLLGEMQDVGAAAADTYAWTAVMDASGRAGRPNVALELLSQMRTGAAGAPEPDIAVYNAAIYAVGMNSRAGWRAARRVYALAEEDGCRPDDVTFSALASVALRHRHRVRERDVVVDIEQALKNRLARLRKENEQSKMAGSTKSNQRLLARRKGTGEAKKLASKLKRIRWLLDNMSNTRR